MFLEAARMFLEAARMFLGRPCAVFFGWAARFGRATPRLARFCAWAARPGAGRAARLGVRARPERPPCRCVCVLRALQCFWAALRTYLSPQDCF
mgnify:CR=1 FL=1